MLRKKMFRDIKNNIMQFITIFLMVFLGVFAFAGVHSYMDGMTKSADEYYENNNLQDIWLMGENFSKEDLNNIKKISNINDAERVLTVNAILENYEDVALEVNFIESNNISKMYVVDGEGFDINKEGLWIDSYLAENLNIAFGDEISFTYHKYKIKEKVLGLINTPDHVYSVKDENEIFPNHKDYGYIYLSVNEFPEDYIYDELKKQMNIDDISIIKSYIKDFNISNYYVFNKVIIDIDDHSKLDETKTDLEKNIKAAIAVTDRDSSSSYIAYNSEIEEGNTYSGVFTFLFLFIALLSVLTTMNRFIKKERTQIGTLKALGYKDGKITLHYIGYGFYISLLAAIVAIISGKYTFGNFFMWIEMKYFEVPEYFTTLEPIVYILGGVVVILVTLFTYLSCKKILKEPASEALRVQVPKVKNAKFSITTKGLFKKSSMSTKWNLRDISRSKGRSIMAIVGIVGSTMLLVSAFGMLDTMNSYLDWQFNKIYNFDYKLTLESNYKQTDYDNLISRYGDSTTETLGIEIKNNGIKETNILTVNDAEEHLKYTDHKKKYISISDDGVYITEKLAKNLNLKIGDNIVWHIFGDDKWYTTKIVGLNRDPQSQQLNMTRSFYENLGLKYKADTIYTNNDLSKVRQLDGVSAIRSVDGLKEGMQNMLNSMTTLVIVLIIVSILLGFVIIYNLGILSFTEKQYQFATLKVLGFKNKQIEKIFVKQNIWLTIISIILGAPLGYYMTDYIFKTALGDTYDFNGYIKPISYIYACVGTFIVSLIVNKMLAKKVNKIDMVSSLKGNE